MTPEPMKLTDLVGEPLVGGTLIEYLRGHGFRREHARATITRIGWHPTQERYFVIETDKPDDACMGIALDYHANPEVWKSPEGVCFWDPPIGWCYAAVPPGAQIPKAGEALDLRIENRDQGCGAAKALAPAEESDYKSAVSKIAALATVQR